MPSGDPDRMPGQVCQKMQQGLAESTSPCKSVPLLTQQGTDHIRESRLTCAKNSET